MKRLFLGVPLPSEVMLNYDDFLKKIKIGADKKELDIKWTLPKNLHFTLKFFGNQDDSLIPSMIEKTTEVIQSYSEFKLSIRNIGAFPDPFTSRVVWLGVQKKRELVQLKNELDSKFSIFNFQEDENEFIPHVTIGRLRKARSVKDLISPFKNIDFGKIQIQKIVLFESQLHNYYPTYIPLHEFQMMTTCLSTSLTGD